MQEDILNFIQLAANVNFYLIIAQCLPSELDITKETTITMGYFLQSGIDCIVVQSTRNAATG
jgi:hypothetical protein